MQLFPTTPVPSENSDFNDTFFTVSGGDDWEDGTLQTRAARVYPVFRANLVYNPTGSPYSTFATLYQFFCTMKGKFGTFSYRDFTGWDQGGIAWPYLFVGVGDGSTTAWDVPMYGSTSRTLYKNGSSTSFSFASGSGVNGRDRVTSVTAADGDILEWGATGQRMVSAHFVNDSMSFKQFCNMLVSTGLGIVETR